MPMLSPSGRHVNGSLGKCPFYKPCQVDAHTTQVHAHDWRRAVCSNDYIVWIVVQCAFKKENS